MKYYKTHKDGNPVILTINSNKQMIKINKIVLHLNYLIEKKIKIIVAR